MTANESSTGYSDILTLRLLDQHLVCLKLLKLPLSCVKNETENSLEASQGHTHTPKSLALKNKSK